MAVEPALNSLHRQAHALTCADEHLGAMILDLQKMRDHEHQDVADDVENRLRFLMLAKACDDMGRQDLARVARDGAALEDQQIERNEALIISQSAAIGLLHAIGGGIERARKFYHRISRAFSDFLAG